MMIRKLSAFVLPTIFFTIIAYTAVNKDFSPEQYERAIWVTTRFYGDQWSGIGPNWLIMEHEILHTELRSLKMLMEPGILKVAGLIAVTT